MAHLETALVRLVNAVSKKNVVFSSSKAENLHRFVLQRQMTRTLRNFLEAVESQKVSQSAIQNHTVSPYNASTLSQQSMETAPFVPELLTQSPVLSNPSTTPVSSTATALSSPQQQMMECTPSSKDTPSNYMMGSAAAPFIFLAPSREPAKRERIEKVVIRSESGADRKTKKSTRIKAQPITVPKDDSVNGQISLSSASPSQSPSLNFPPTATPSPATSPAVTITPVADAAGSRRKRTKAHQLDREPGTTKHQRAASSPAVSQLVAIAPKPAQLLAVPLCLPWAQLYPRQPAQQLPEHAGHMSSLPWGGLHYWSQAQPFLPCLVSS